MKNMIQKIRVVLGAIVLVGMIGYVAFYLYQEVIKYWQQLLVILCVLAVWAIGLWAIKGFSEWLFNRE